MQKYIPIALKDHYRQEGVTTCLLSRIMPKSGVLEAYTNLDVDIGYDPAAYDPGNTGDDWGYAVHLASNGGATMAQLQAASSLTVDNTDVTFLPGTESISVERALSGYYDNADIRIYRINYDDTSMGHECIAVGKLGNCKVSNKIAIVEFRSLTQQLIQPDVRLYQITCEHKFGSPRCGKAFTWELGTVTSVDPANSTKLFGSDVAFSGLVDDFYVPGVIEWLTGDNAEKQMEVEQNTGSTFLLSLPMLFGIQVGDTFRVRQDCSKIWDDAEHGCIYHYDATNRAKKFGGYPDIPVADGGVAMIPGGQVGAREET
jgi:uncharacterized phage protein (TIGR02218 family)